MMISRIVSAPLLAFFLSACVGGPPAKNNVVYYDLPGTPSDLSAPLRNLDVSPSSWMNGNAMYYRLAYADGSRRNQYAETRWTSQPAELLTVRLQRSLMSGAPGACRLHIDLDDLTQVFDSAQASRLQLDARVALYGAHQEMLARKVFSLGRPAGNDAKGGVAASGELADDFARQLQDWVRQSCR